MSKKLLTAASLLLVLPALILAQNAQLGSVNFPTTGSAEAQSHFLRGLAALHSLKEREPWDRRST